MSTGTHQPPPRHSLISSLILVCLVCSPAAFGIAGEAPAGPISGWRGDGSGRFPEATPPIEWDGETGKNILWKTKVGLSKFSSPAVVKDKIFVVAEPAQLLCLDAADGKILWTRANGFADLPVKVEEKPALGQQGNTTPTPVSDGRFVYAAFGSGIVACYDLEGARQWIQFLEAPPGLDFGRSSSPALLGDLLLVSVHHLFALEAKTGKVVWKNESVTERYGTPIAARLGGVALGLTPSGQIVRVADGRECFTATELQYASPVVQGSVAYFVGTSSSAVTISANGGEVAFKAIWKTDLEGSYYASPVYDQGLLYTASNEGVLLILDATDGRIVASKELPISSGAGRPNQPNANIYPSLALAGKYVFVSNDMGDTLVLESGREGKEVRRNNLGEGFSGAPVFAGSRMYVRAKERLYCVGVK